jgi:hypothetical protein
MRRLAWRLSSLVFLLMALVPLYNGSVFCMDVMESRRSPGDRLVWGTVIRREYARQWWRPIGPRLVVKIDGTPITVNADLINDAIDTLPDRVSFYYSGDRSKEVRLLCETSLFTDILFFWATSALLASVAVVSWVWSLSLASKPGAGNGKTKRVGLEEL